MKFPVKWLALPLVLSIMPAAGAGAPSVHKADDDAITAIAIQAAAQSLKLDAEQLKLAAPPCIKRLKRAPCPIYAWRCCAATARLGS